MNSHSGIIKKNLSLDKTAEIMTTAERRLTDILVVEPDNQQREVIRNALIASDFQRVYISGDHASALKVLKSRNFTHVIFCAQHTNMPAASFISECMELSPKLIAVASSYSPDADDVFNLLRQGARGFLVKPYNISTLDSAIVLATTSAPLPDIVLHAPNRNDAFATLLASSLDRYALAARQAKTFSTAKPEMAKCAARLENISRISQMFAQKSKESLQESIVNLMIALSEGPATRLGRLRGKLREKRIKASN